MARHRHPQQDIQDLLDQHRWSIDLGYYLPVGSHHQKRLAVRGIVPQIAGSHTVLDFLLNMSMECWLITSRAEVMRLEFGDEPPAEICLPDKPLLEIEDNAVAKAIQDAPYITYRRFHLAHESWRLGIVYSIAPPTVGDIQILSAYRAGHEARPHLV
jgi:hypothetical protein